MIIGWRSPLDGRVYGLEDYAALGHVIPEPVLRAMSKKAQLDTRHQGPGVTITGGLSCPRKTAVSRMLPSTPDPTKMWKMQRGTWLHEMVGLALGENEEWWTEETSDEHCVYEGEVFGVRMSCKVDALKKDYSHIIDWKFRGDGAEKWIDPMGVAKPEDAAQVNMARMLIEQAIGRELPEMLMQIWVMAGRTVLTTAPHMSEGRLGEIHPGGGTYSIAEIFKLVDRAMSAWKQAGSGDPDSVPMEERQKIIASLPMVGETMYRKKRAPSLNMCTSYCEFQDECYGCSGGL